MWEINTSGLQVIDIWIVQKLGHVVVVTPDEG